jgi:hypothetical protein
MTSQHANQVVPEVVDHAGVRVQHFAVSGSPGAVMIVPAAVAPTQVRRPWRSTARTIFQATISLAAMWGLIVAALDLPDWAWVGTSIAVAGGITRVMAIPAVEAWLRRFFPFLAAAPAPKTTS